MAFDWTTLIGPAFNAIAGAGQSYLENSYMEDREDQKYDAQLQQQREDTLLKLQLEALKGKYGAGGGGAPRGLSEAERIAAMRGASNDKISALQALIASYQQAFGGG